MQSSDKKIEELNKKIIDDSPEEFLRALVPLLDNHTLTKEEMDKIKSILYAKRMRCVGIRTHP